MIGAQAASQKATMVKRRRPQRLTMEWMGSVCEDKKVPESSWLNFMHPYPRDSVLVTASRLESMRNLTFSMLLLRTYLRHLEPLSTQYVAS